MAMNSCLTEQIKEPKHRQSCFRLKVFEAEGG
jgi:hypothetical protein